MGEDTGRGLMGWELGTRRSSEGDAVYSYSIVAIAVCEEPGLCAFWESTLPMELH